MSINDIIGPAQPLRTERLPETTYRAMPRMNASTLVNGLRGAHYDPFAVKWAWENPKASTGKRAKNQDDLDRGTLAHLCMLEPLEVPNRVAIWKGSRRAGKEWEEFSAANEHKLIVPQQTFAEVTYGCMAAMQNPTVQRLLSGGRSEVSFLWSEDDVRCKGRVDYLPDVDPLGIVNIVDLKTTERGIDDRSTDRTVIDLRYREKQSLYRRARAMKGDVDKECIRCTLIFVQLTPPFGVNVKPLDSICLDHFEARMIELLKRTRDAIEHDNFAPMSIESAMGLMPWEQADIDHEMEEAR